MAVINFDAATVTPNTPLEPVPAGVYVATVVASEMKPTKSGSGVFLELIFEIISGEYQGRKLCSRLNLQHQNSKVVEIARGDLSAICRAVGVMAIRDSAELHNKPLLITVRSVLRPDTGGLRSEIRGYSALETPPAAPKPVVHLPLPPVPVPAVPSPDTGGGAWKR